MRKTSVFCFVLKRKAGKPRRRGEDGAGKPGRSPFPFRKNSVLLHRQGPAFKRACAAVKVAETALCLASPVGERRLQGWPAGKGAWG